MRVKFFTLSLQGGRGEGEGGARGRPLVHASMQKPEGFVIVPAKRRGYNRIP
jgi:hypothetical protein